MHHPKPTQILGHLEYEVNLPAARTVHSRKKTQIIKANLNTTVQDIIDEVCKKQEYEIKDYQLWFGQKKLDNQVSLRHSGLPVNGVLQLLSTADAAKLLDAEVNLGLQLESGTRLTHKFHHEKTLWNVVQYWESQGEKILLSSQEGESKMIPVCHYMRQTISGQDQLKTNTLKSLGLTHGSAVIRFFHREENQFGQQANVSSVISVPIQNEDTKPSSSVKIATNDVPRSIVPPSNVTATTAFDSGNTLGTQSEKTPSETESLSKSDISNSTVQDSKSTNDENIPIKKEHDKKIKEEEVKPMDIDEEIGTNFYDSNNPNDVESDGPLKYSTKDKLCVLGSNNAMLYHLDDVRTRKNNMSEPDDFFEITIRDVQSIYRGLKEKTKEFEEAPLQTTSLRQDEQNLLQDRMIKEHPITVVRVRFPDRFVLQGTFETTDYIASLASFVQDYLDDPTVNFELFTTPPRTILDNSKTLLSSSLFGFAIIYFSATDVSGKRPNKYLRDHVYSNCSDPAKVFKNSSTVPEVSSVRKVPPSQSGVIASSSTVADSKDTLAVSSQSSSSSSGASGSSSHSQPVRAPSGAVPKWFKGATTKK